VFPEVMPSEIPVRNKVCCSTDKSKNCDPCTEKKKPLSEDCMVKDADKLKAICSANPLCCCDSWDQKCVIAAEKAGLCTKDTNP
jgi:hypothetical protein